MFANLTIRIAALTALSLVSGAGSAATMCSLAIGNVVFGSYDVFSPTSLDTSATVIVTCSRDGGPQNINVTIAIGPGAHGGSTASRKMRMPGGDLLAYNLFRDAGRTSVWGQVPGLDAFTQTLAVPNKSSAQLSVMIFGRIPAGQDVLKGTYSDNVVLTVMP
ncbi:MAG: spore coat protein U domain-containing protein [Burkholderiales bacterium]|nr:spore coat protein U domain-containing protein [Burkholderiales bacterium]